MIRQTYDHWIQRVILFVSLGMICSIQVAAQPLPQSFHTLQLQFQKPDKQYGSAPLWVWNTKITRDIIDSMLQEFKDNSFGGVMVHPRPGLVTEYLSDEWLDLWKYAMNKAKALDMDIWIYDENSYPSGFAGGYVPDEMPESWKDGQMLRMKKTHQAESNTFSYEYEKVHYYTASWYAGFSYVDLMVPGVTEKFIDVTMKRGYEKIASDEFGKTVKGIFSDEPNIESWDTTCVRWTPLLYPTFKKMWGYDLQPHLPALFENTGDYRKIRHNYRETLLQLFIDNWAKPMYNYTTEKGLEWTGHYWEHEWPSPNHVPDNMAMYAWHQRPAIDMLFNQFNDHKHDAQFGNIRVVKELASVANQLDKKRTLSETYGGAGWELTFKDMKRLGDWEYVLGVNTLNQHLAYMTLDGTRKYDYPPSFSYHNTWWSDYKQLNEYFARLSLALSSGKQKNDILVIEPTTSAWMYFVGAGDRKRFSEIAQDFQTFVVRIEKAQVEYDLGSEDIIKNAGKVIGNKFVVGSAQYTTVVLPPGIENVNLPTFNLLAQFAKNGGRILSFDDLQYLDGAKDARIDQLRKQCQRVQYTDAFDNSSIDKYLGSAAIKFSPQSGKQGDLYHHRRIMEDGQLVFLANSSMTDAVKGTFVTRGNSAAIMDAMTGKIYNLPVTKKKNGNIEIEYSIAQAGSMLVFTSDKDISVSDRQVSNLSPAKKVATSPLQTQRLNPNVLTIDFCDLVMKDTTIYNKYFDDISNSLFYKHGFHEGNPWCSSVQFKNNIIKRDTFGIDTAFDVNYHFTVNSDRPTGLSVVVERIHLWDVYLNGIKLNPTKGKWWLDKDFAVFDLKNHVRKGKNTITLKAPRMNVFAEIEPVYILGDFGLSPQTQGWAIEPAQQLRLGSWKNMGMPLYGNQVRYTKTFDVADTNKHYKLKPGVWAGTVANLSVNDRRVAILIGNETEVDISEYVRKGKNKVEFTVTGSLKNTLGPFYHNEPKGMASPWHWKYVPVMIPGEKYDLIDYGLMQDFDIVTK